MHELALSQNILEIAKSHMGEDQRLKTVVVECGPFSGVEADSLDYCFSITAKHFGLDGADLKIRLLEAEATCPLCSTKKSINSMWASCDKCGHAPLTAKGGRDFRIVEIEVEEVNRV